MAVYTQTNREAWLHAAAELIRPMLAEHGLTLNPYRIGVGDAAEGKAAGLCYVREIASDKVHEITISFRLRSDGEILGTLAHELIHACGIRNHYRDFAAAAKAIGLYTLTGKWQDAGLDGPDSTIPPAYRAIMKELGPYPAGTATPRGRRKRKAKQSTRMLKAQCRRCELTVRVSRKWADFVERCPDSKCGGTMTVEGLEE